VGQGGIVPVRRTVLTGGFGAHAFLGLDLRIRMRGFMSTFSLFSCDWGWEGLNWNTCMLSCGSVWFVISVWGSVGAWMLVSYSDLYSNGCLSTVKLSLKCYILISVLKLLTSIFILLISSGVTSLNLGVSWLTSLKASSYIFDSSFLIIEVTSCPLSPEVCEFVLNDLMMTLTALTVSPGIDSQSAVPWFCHYQMEYS